MERQTLNLKRTQLALLTLILKMMNSGCKLKINNTLSMSTCKDLSNALVFVTLSFQKKRLLKGNHAKYLMRRPLTN
jgi:hypothetical protein